MEDGWGCRIMVDFVALRAKTYSYWIVDGSEDKNAKGTRNCVIKRKGKFENYKNCVEEIQLETKTSRTKWNWRRWS